MPLEFSKTVFMTGFPGFIAGRLVERLAAGDVQFFLLVQPPFVEQAKAAVSQIAERSSSPLENFALVQGDITLPNLGIDRDDLSVIRDETTDVFHLAAAYDLEVTRDVAEKVNLEGTKNVNHFARSLEGLRRYNYISTCYVAGKRPGRVYENELEHDAGFRNHYEETKYLAETEVEQLKEELPVTIYRPSVVVGDSETGETPKFDGIYFLIHYLRKAPGLLRFINVGNNEVRLNLVPVDYVISAISALSADEDAVGKTIALADPAPLTTAELFDEIARSMSGGGSFVRPPATLVERSLMLPMSPGLTGLPHSAVPYFFLSQTYDTTVASQLLAPHKISCPDFRSYVSNLIDFVKKHPSL
ncbi:MAG: SDR family oxidoreductase [Blastocatellia bacterium]|nr:SDR family oxidoreductase [Blastocatellia bacterium]